MIFTYFRLPDMLLRSGSFAILLLTSTMMTEAFYIKVGEPGPVDMVELAKALLNQYLLNGKERKDDLLKGSRLFKFPRTLPFLQSNSYINRPEFNDQNGVLSRSQSNADTDVRVTKKSRTWKGFIYQGSKLEDKKVVPLCKYGRK